MKKFITMSLMALALFSSMPVMAEDAVVAAEPAAIEEVASGVAFSVSPSVGVNFYDEFDTAVAVGVDVKAQNVFTNYPEVEFSTGLNYAGTEVNGSKADVDFYTIPFEVGYRQVIDEKLSVKPYAAANVILADSAADVDDTVGLGIGAEFSYEIKENLSANLRAGYQFAEVDVNGLETSLNGATIGGGVSYKF